jgi:outer membrane protein assembly factor BamD (BamD/ComL family)
MKTTILCMLFFALSLFAITSHNQSTANATINEKRPQELFLEGARALSANQFDRSRILLNTLIYTYPESPFAEQAKMLVFYSFAREGGPKNEKAVKLLQEIEEQLKAYYPNLHDLENK